MLRFIPLTMAAEGAMRRVRNIGTLLRLGQSGQGKVRYLCTSSDGKFVTIGDVSIQIRPPKNPELVPRKYLAAQIPQSVLKHLRWIMQKDVLGQDVFLIGPPGPLRRAVAMMYLELTQKEAEYVSLSRDTTETDLKQRREIRGGTAFYVDQCAVKAATEGRVLILEGIEKAERNVLPVLNNLLENREMQLDDGRFLMAAERYDKLIQEHSREELDAWKLVRVDENFRVIALGLPVPRYQGNPLDPPLRSRFQARDVDPIPFKDHVEVLNAVGDVPPDKLSQILSFASTLKSEEANTLGLQDFPIDNLHSVIKILNAVPSASPHRLLQRLYPYDVMLGKEGKTAVKDALKSFELWEGEQRPAGGVITEIRRGPEGAQVQLQLGRQHHSFPVTSGTIPQVRSREHFVHTNYHDELLADMMQSHLAGDFCIIGPRGCGKSAMANQFADLLGYHVEQIMLYQDMTSRDLLQQRMTMPSGDTAWRHAPLVTAALEGSLAVLDGVHRVNAGTFAILHRLIHNRELTLFDGSRLLRHDRYDGIKEENNFTEDEMKDRGLFRIHPSFRIMALSEPPVVSSSTGQWMNSEILTMFQYHHMRSLSKEEELQVLSKIVRKVNNMQPVMELTHKLRESADTNLKSVSTSLSTRQLLRIGRRLAEYPDENVYDTIQKACLARFLPRLARNTLEEVLSDLEIIKPTIPASVESMEKSITCEIRDGVLRIGNTTVPVFNTETKMKVPDVLFYENAQHLAIMEDMLKDYLLGEHLLLVGNQGVGKNKIVDRFLYLLNRPREYLQLHRDTTVQTLTLQPTVRDGVILYEDSPLVRAVKHGHILVVDEADKAPTHVTCILKTLVESGEMHLADGRRIVDAHSGMKPSESVIVAHPDFRMVVLANRPGFPFLGNDFFGAMGDIYSAHAVDNPDYESEMAMLRQYGPSVPEDILRKLVLAFGELRDMADQGLINYPYSTREVVNMVKHLHKYPDEGLASVVKNVFDFDSYNKELKETVVETLHKHGIPVGADPRNILLAKEFPLPAFQHVGQWNVTKQGDFDRLGRCPVEDRHLKIKGPVTGHVQSYRLERTEARSVLFTEQEAFWTIPLHEVSAVVEVAVTKGSQRQPGQINDDIIHIATVNPVTLYTMNPQRRNLTWIDLYDLFPTTMGSGFKPRINMATLGFPLDNQLILHDEWTNITLNVNWENGEVTRLSTSTMGEAAVDRLNRTFRNQQGLVKMCGDFAHDPDGMLLFYKEEGQSIDMVFMLEGRCHSVLLPIKVDTIHMPSRYDWLITESGTGKRYMLSHTKESPFEFNLKSLDDNIQSEGGIHQVDFTATQPLDNSLMSATLGQTISSPNRVLATENSYATMAVGFPDLSSIDIHQALRLESHEGNKEYMTDTFPRMLKMRKRNRTRPPVAYMPESGQLIRALPTWNVPKEVYPQSKRPKNLSAYLEVTDMVNKKLRYIPVPGVTNLNVYSQWYSSGAESSLVLAPMTNDGLVTVDSAGCVRLWETSLYHLDDSIRQWKGLIGQVADKPLQITIEKELDKQIPPDLLPKHGKVDPTGAKHVGGNMFAGGMGGMGTAGLGGVGGPYRLSGGFDEIVQVPDWQKDQVPEDVKRAAREMAHKAWKERLKQIEMSEFDGDLYERYLHGVRAQVKSLRVILDSLQAKGKERQWLKHQTYGDLDDSKLIEGLTGEKAIYKRRGERDPEMGSPQQKPKLVKLLCDVSGSMYRFDGHDGRLEREMEAMLMVMEAFDSYEQKIKYEIIGHSGEGYKFDFTKGGKPPKNNKERLDVLKNLHAHSQFCISGDHTLEAAEHAIKTIVDEEADEYFVVVLSDANVDRYGIRPKHFADVLTANEDVNSYVIFIGSLGDQATRLLKQMPSGRAFICMDTKNLPQILQQIFTSTMLSTR